MPECRKCHRVAATCEMRRTKLGSVCREKFACTQRVKQIREALRAAK